MKKTLNWSQIKQSWLVHGLNVLVFLCLAGFLISCDGNLFEDISDDDSYEARLEEGLMALDDEDYDKAVDLFLDLREDYSSKEEVCVYLSNAYAGLTGIDTFNLLETIDELEETDDEGSIDMIGLLLGDARGEIDADQVDAKSDLLSKAKTAIEDCIDTPNSDERVQEGLLALGDAALFIADLVMRDQGTDTVELTEDGLDDLYEGIGTIEFDDDLTAQDMQEFNDIIDEIADAVVAIEELVGEDDLSESFDEFLEDLDGNGDGVVVISELEQYIANL